MPWPEMEKAAKTEYLIKDTYTHTFKSVENTLLPCFHLPGFREMGETFNIAFRIEL